MLRSLKTGQDDCLGGLGLGSLPRKGDCRWVGATFGSEEAYSFPLGDIILSFVSSVSFTPAGLHINLPGKYSWKMSFSKWKPIIRHQPVVYST